MKGLVNKIVINFRWDAKGFRIIARRAKKLNMSKEAYLRYCVEQEHEISLTHYES
jgi:hypothetical protein